MPPSCIWCGEVGEGSHTSLLRKLLAMHSARPDLGESGFFIAPDRARRLRAVASPSCSTV